MRRLVVRARDLDKRQGSAVVSRAGIDIFDGEPVDFRNVRLRNSGSATLHKLREVVNDVRLIGDFKSLLFFESAEERIGSHGYGKSRADNDCRPRWLFLNRFCDLFARDTLVLKASVPVGPIALELDGGRTDFGTLLNDLFCLPDNALF